MLHRLSVTPAALSWCSAHSGPFPTASPPLPARSPPAAPASARRIVPPSQIGKGRLPGRPRFLRGPIAPQRTLGAALVAVADYLPRPSLRRLRRALHLDGVVLARPGRFPPGRLPVAHS